MAGTQEGWRKGNDINAEIAKGYDMFMPFACVKAETQGDDWASLEMY